MRRDKRRKEEEDGLSGKKMLYIVGSILALAVIAFVVTFLIYSSKMDNDPQIANIRDNDEIIGEIKQSEPTSTSYGKNVEEMQKSEEKKVNENKMAINTNNVEKPKNNEKTNKEKINQVKAPKQNSGKEEVKENKKEEKVVVKDPEFKRPVDGEIIKEFANNKLVYSNTLDVWTTHLGIDIKADKTTVVKASADGKVISIKNDPRYGLTIIIEHANGYKTVYANLLSAEFVVEGENIKQGESIGTVGDTSSFEVADEPHLHFELMKDNEELDPELFFK